MPSLHPVREIERATSLYIRALQQKELLRAVPEKYFFYLFFNLFEILNLKNHNQKVLETTSKGVCNNLWKPIQQKSQGTYIQFIKFLSFPHNQYVTLESYLIENIEEISLLLQVS